MLAATWPVWARTASGAREVIDVNGEDAFAKQPVAREVGDGRAEAAVGIVAFVALEPVVHRAARVLEHFKFLH